MKEQEICRGFRVDRHVPFPWFESGPWVAYTSNTATGVEVVLCYGGVLWGRREKLTFTAAWRLLADHAGEVAVSFCRPRIWLFGAFVVLDMLYTHWIQDNPNDETKRPTFPATITGRPRRQRKRRQRRQ